MPRLQAYLPDDLYEQVKARGLPASELLQKAVRAGLSRQELLAETDRYVAESGDGCPPNGARQTPWPRLAGPGGGPYRWLTTSIPFSSSSSRPAITPARVRLTGTVA